MLVHRNELIMPAGPAEAFRSLLSGGASGGGGGGVNVNLNVTAWDAANIQGWLRTGGVDVVAKAVARAMSRNLGARPSFA
jgi:hypothetical protein